MDDRVVQFRVGVMVLASLIIAGILVLLFGSIPRLTTPKKTIYISFPQATGVTRETPVRKFGILIGRVTDVEFAADAGVLVTAEIFDDSKINLRTNEICQVSGSLLGGDAVIQFVGKNDKLPDKPAEGGARFVGLPAVDPIQAISGLETTLTRTVTSVTTTSDEIGNLARRITDMLQNSDEQLGRIANKAEDTLDKLNSIAKNTDFVLDEQVRDNLKKAFLDLPGVISDTKEAINGFKTTLDTADRNLQNIEGLTKPLGQRGGQLVDNMESTMRKLDRVLTEMQQFSKSLNDPRGSLGQLLNDKEFYTRINSAVTNIDTITRDVRPILRDAREFTNRIKRHPELLGVGGALRPSTGAN